MALGHLSRRAFIGGVGAAAMTLMCPKDDAFAQSQVGQLKLLCGFPPGSIPDLVARQIAANLAGNYATGCIVENRPGAAGQIAIGALKNGPTDGSVLLVAPGAVATDLSLNLFQAHLRSRNGFGASLGRRGSSPRTRNRPRGPRPRHPLSLG